MGAAVIPPEPPSRGRGAGNADRILALISMMADGPVMMLVNANGDGVVVPQSMREKHGAALPLLVAWNKFLQKPLEDLMIDDNGIQVTMGFSGQPFHVVVPWTAIWRIYSESRNILYGECVPAGIVAAVQNHNPAKPEVVQNSRKTKPALSLVSMPDDVDEIIEKTPAILPDEWPALRLVPDEPDEPAPSVL